MNGSSGLHHVTAIAGDPQINIDYYMGFLGLGLVKLAVNFDNRELAKLMGKALACTGRRV